MPLDVIDAASVFKELVFVENALFLNRYPEWIVDLKLPPSPLWVWSDWL